MNEAVYHFCTIASPDYLPFANALLRSLQRQSAAVQLHVLVTDDVSRINKDGLTFYRLQELVQNNIAERIIHKYPLHSNELRWSLKPVFLQHLLSHHDKIFYADNDLFFFSAFDFLFEMLNETSLVLSPHWCSFDAENQNENFQMNFRLGLFNGGLIGATKEASNFLKWWAQACLHTLSKNVSEGYYDDQRYLDAAMVIHPHTGIIRHLGCNIGSWNMHQNKRIKVGGDVLINGIDPIVCIHFNNETIKHIANGNDGLLGPHLKEFEKAVTEEGGDIYTAKNLDLTASHSSAGTSLKKSLRLRTRLKAWLLSLSKKL